MRLDPVEFPELPLAAALLDHRRQPVVWTPEWRGWSPGDVVYFAGHGHLATSDGGEANPVLRTVLGELLGALDDLRAELPADDASRLRVLVAGLRVVAGEVIDEGDGGTGDEVLEMARLAVAARVVPSIQVRVTPAPPLQVPAPAVVALALVQLVVNVARHEWQDAAQTRRVGVVTLRAAPGPGFFVEWPSARTSAERVATHRHVDRRQRWGLGYVRLAADALGGTALPPAPAGPGLAAAGFGLGARNLALPLCCEEPGAAPRTTRAWDQEHDTAGEDETDRSTIAALRRAALQDPGRIVAAGYHAARAVPRTRRVWLAMPPESGDARVRDALRGLDHEQALLRAPEPHATRLHALNVLLRAGLQDAGAITTCYRQDWLRRFPPAMRAAGLPVPAVHDAAVYPDPLLAAWLLGEYGGRLDVDATGSVWFSSARLAQGVSF
ncbi:MAG: hypothetical protein ACREQM_22230 [Candidatus Dormibacteraceae bacterium]